MMADTGGISVFTQWRLPENVASIRSLRRETFGFLLATSHSICLMLSLKFCILQVNLFCCFIQSVRSFLSSLWWWIDRQILLVTHLPLRWSPHVLQSISHLDLPKTLLSDVCVCVMPKGYRRWCQYTYLHAMSCISKVDKYIPVEQYKCIHTD